MSYKYCVYQEAKGNECDYPRIEEFKTKAEVNKYIRDCKREDHTAGRPDRPWHIDKIHSCDQYLVTYEHAHGARPNSKHEKVVWAHNAKEAHDIVMSNYWQAYNELFARHGTCKNAAKYGVRYPFHIHAVRLPE